MSMCKAGELITCSDEAIYEYILYLNSQRSPDSQFVITKIPHTHIFVKEGHEEELKKAINDLVKENTFTEEDRDKKKKKVKKN